MIGKTNSGGGGGFVYGIIAVTYPAGSALTIETISGGSGVPIKKDYSATQRLYYVKAAGSYRITATDGTYTTSKDVSIVSLGQSAAIMLSYALILIDGTFLNTEDAGSWTREGLKVYSSGYQDAVPTLESSDPYTTLLVKAADSGTSVHRGGVLRCTNRVNLSAYRYLVLEYDVEDASSSASTGHHAFASLLAHAGDSMPSTQDGVTFKVNLDYAVQANNNQKLSNQKLIIDLASQQISDPRYLIAVGINANNYATRTIVTIKKLYATNSVD